VAPLLEELRRDPDRSGLELLLINLWEGVDAAREARQFCDIWGIPHDKVLLDESAQYARALGVPGVPTNVLVDADGIVRAVGASTRRELYAAADELLAAPRRGSAAGGPPSRTGRAG
jgi:hypothetical protein